MLVIHPFDVTVILPMYNAAAYAPFAVASVLEQDFDGNIELIAVDDGSTDDTFEVVSQLARKDPRTFVRLIQQDNQGVSAARNKGLEYATGEFVAFLDADDQLMPSFCSQMISAARIDHADLVLGARKTVKADGDMRPLSPEKLQDFGFSRFYAPFRQDFLADLFWDKDMGHVIWGNLYKKRLLGDFSHTHYFEDYPYNLNFMSRCRAISAISEQVYCHRVGTGHAMTDGQYANCGWEARVVEDYIVRRFIEQLSGAALSEENLAKADGKILALGKEAIAGGTDADVVTKSTRYREALSRSGR